MSDGRQFANGQDVAVRATYCWKISDPEDKGESVVRFQFPKCGQFQSVPDREIVAIPDDAVILTGAEAERWRALQEALAADRKALAIVLSRNEWVLITRDLSIMGSDEECALAAKIRSQLAGQGRPMTRDLDGRRAVVLTMDEWDAVRSSLSFCREFDWARWPTVDDKIAVQCAIPLPARDQSDAHS